ncbi:hypothetical protein [uncultured Limosilactobacillus sp.]|uniref:hypothetical protein n=1 Tax=uncultured Limosilactobacillus sp. TaxID=2837629 RepID=UPI0025E169CC|nr:hypothetical protein [uncultured Limosilactobacillus sp.]
MSRETGQQLVMAVRHYFHRLPETRYSLSVVNVPADQQYHYFFYIRRRGVSTRSLPLAVEPAKLDLLIDSLTIFRQSYQLPVNLVGFSQDQRRRLHQLTR